MKELPGQLESDEGLAGAADQRQQNALLPVGDGFQHPLDSDALVITTLKIAAPILERYGGKAVAPYLLDGKGAAPKFIGSRVLRQLTLNAGIHINTVNALAVAGISKSNCQLARVVLSLTRALGQRLVPRLGLNYRQLGVAVLQHIIGGQRLAAFA